MANSDRQRHEHEPAYVLHSYPFRETSLVVEVFTRRLGRLGLVARGARRARSALRGTLMAFQPLLLSWGGRAELRTLHAAEWRGGVPQLRGRTLVCGFYLNELLLKFLPRDDPHESLFDLYAESIAAFATGADVNSILRRFEKNLLKELGYALLLECEAGTGARIDPSARYAYVLERGPMPAGPAAGESVEVTGKTLLDIACDNYADPVTQQQSKLLMRHLVAHYLGSQSLHTRQLLLELQQL